MPESRPDNPAAARLAPLAMARQMQRARVAFASVLPPSLFHDSAWDMMLELFVAGQEGRPVFVKELSLVSGEAPTTALRRIVRLEEAGLLVRRPDPADLRRIRVELSDQGNHAMTVMMNDLYS